MATIRLRLRLQGNNQDLGVMENVVEMGFMPIKGDEILTAIPEDDEPVMAEVTEVYYSIPDSAYVAELLPLQVGTFPPQIDKLLPRLRQRNWRSWSGLPQKSK